jgi:uncharacterized membrane protein YphA (DoxX/SURF4 family)
MKNLIVPGRFFLAVAVIAFGVEHLIYAITRAGLGPPWTPVNHLLAFVIGILLIAGGAGVATGIQVRCAAIMLACVFIIRAILCYTPKLAANIRDPAPWTSSFELLAIGGASLVLVAMSATRTPRSGRSRVQPSALLSWGQNLFAVSLIVFGIQHLMYGPFVATLITPWIPGHLFWAYFVGVAFIASALAIASGILAPLAATLLGTMFFLWVVVLHAPRVAAALHNANEWTSLLVALAMSGGAFIVAGALAERD